MTEQSEKALIQKRNLWKQLGLLGGVGASATLATQTHAVITGDQVKATYDKSGADSTTDSTGLIVITIAISLVVISTVKRIVK